MLTRMLHCVYLWSAVGHTCAFLTSLICVPSKSVVCVLILLWHCCIAYNGGCVETQGGERKLHVCVCVCVLLMFAMLSPTVERVTFMQGTVKWTSYADQKREIS